MIIADFHLGDTHLGLAGRQRREIYSRDRSSRKSTLCVESEGNGSRNRQEGFTCERKHRGPWFIDEYAASLISII